MSVTRHLLVDCAGFILNQPVITAEIYMRRAYQVDTFVTAVDFKHKVLNIENQAFDLQLLPNTWGTYYELVLFGKMYEQLHRLFFIMPDHDSDLENLDFLTSSYQPINAIATSFIQLADTPNSYAGHAGKSVSVKADGSGLEFIVCVCDDDDGEEGGGDNGGGDNGGGDGDGGETEIPIQQFDFAVIRYIWTESGGRDLDTRTRITNPQRNVDVGWSRSGNDQNFLTWGGDNTGMGVESILLDLKSLQETYPINNGFTIECRAFWYSQAISGDLKIQFEMYRGGTMQQQGYDFINIGGLVTGNHTINVNTMLQQSSNIDGTFLAYLHYDPLTNTGTLNKVIENV
jgi:hypothetical protein